MIGVILMVVVVIVMNNGVLGCVLANAGFVVK